MTPALCLLAALLKPAPLDDRFVSFGANVGAHLLDTDPALQVGWEVSLIWTDLGGDWQGLYLDTVLIPDRVFVQSSFGAEIGWSFVGLDAGLVTLVTDEAFTYGARLRLIGTLALVGVYAGAGILGGRGAYAEGGVLVKIPIPVPM